MDTNIPDSFRIGEWVLTPALHTVEHPELGPVKLLGWPARLSQSEVPIKAAPLLGQHTDAVLAEELGASASELAALREAGVIA